MKIHIFTGGKGGTGKTLTALSTCIHFMRNRIPVLIIDLNYQNLDLYRNFYARNDVSLGDTGFQIMRIGLNDELQEVGNERSDNIVAHYLVYPGPHKVGRLSRGALGFYGDIETILEAVARGQGGIDNGFRPLECIVDTGFHLTNLNAEGEAYEIRYEEAFPYLLHATPNICYIWTIAALFRGEEIQASRDAIAWLGRLPSTDRGRPGRWFSDTHNLTHVINPYALSPDISLINFRPRAQVVIKKLENLLYADVDQPRPYDAIMRLFRTEVINSGSDERIDWLEQMTGNMELRPANIYTIPYYVRFLTGYTDEFDRSRGRDINPLTFLGIQQELGAIAQSISTCISRDTR